MKFARSIALLVLLGSIFCSSQSAKASNPEGRWGGTWSSQSSGHQGKLCARISQIDACTYKAKFSGTFFGIVPFVYSVPLTVTGQGEDGRTFLSGRARLPFFGTFCCNAEITQCDFIARYTSPKDNGQFVMRRK